MVGVGVGVSITFAGGSIVTRLTDARGALHFSRTLKKHTYYA